MSAEIIEYDTVRVIALHGSPESHLAITGCSRSPAIGDLGTVVDFVGARTPRNRATRFIVESNEGGAGCVWLAEFSSDELELVEGPCGNSTALTQTASCATERAKLVEKTVDRLRQRWLESMPAHDVHRRYVEEREVLPVWSDMGGFYGLTAAGAVLEFAWDGDDAGKLIEDPRLVNVALFQGASRYAELRFLRPQRPRDAQDCTACGGTGKFAQLPSHLRDKVVCYCGGAGWLPPGTAQMRQSEEDRNKRWWQFWRR